MFEDFKTGKDTNAPLYYHTIKGIVWDRQVWVCAERYSLENRAEWVSEKGLILTASLLPTEIVRCGLLEENSKFSYEQEI